MGRGSGLLAAALFAIAGTVSASAEDCRPDRVELRGDWGQAAFTAEIADSAEARATGLMHRDSLARSASMLFVYEYPQRVAFWMKNTLIPLDMIFLDRRGVVQHVHHQAVPHDLTPIPGGDAIYAVLEINGGLAALYGISKGSQMRHPVFSGGPAIWPC
jgi:hypothetical protein